MTSKRNIAAVLGGIAAVALFLIVNPWFAVDPKSTADQIVTVTFWVSFLALLVVLFEMRKEPGGETIEIEGPGVHAVPVRQLAGRPVLAADPPVRRLHLARGRLPQVQRQRLDGRRRGAAGLLAARRRGPGGRPGSPAITYDWYRTFLQTLLDNNAYTWFAPLITFGEMAVGLGLLLGVLTGFAAFFGALMNMSFLLAGSASINPVLFTLAIGLILAWKVAGYYGVDRYLLPMLGTPWHPGPVQTGTGQHPVGRHPPRSDPRHTGATGARTNLSPRVVARRPGGRSHVPGVSG